MDISPCINECNRIIQHINLTDTNDRVGTQLVWYISSILLAVKNNYKISFNKPKTHYCYCTSIFGEALFSFIEEYNETNFPNTSGNTHRLVHEGHYFFHKHIYNVINIKSDYITAFKENILTQKFKDNLHELAEKRGYVIPYNSEKSIVVHLRLDDRQHHFVSDEDRKTHSMNFRNIIDKDDIHFSFPGYGGQSAIKEEMVQEIIEKALSVYKDYEVVIITNGPHNLPYKTISNTDESYDLFLLCNSAVFIGSMSTFSFAALLFGNHKHVYYPLWDHMVCFGLTTKYDKTNTVECF